MSMFCFYMYRYQVLGYYVHVMYVLFALTSGFFARLSPSGFFARIFYIFISDIQAAGGGHSSIMMLMITQPLLLSVFLLIGPAQLATPCAALAFQLPKFPNPFGGGPSSSSPSTASSSSSALRPGDRVLVIGGTGGVGQLVTKKLRSRPSEYSVRVASRDVARAAETIADDGVEVVKLNLVGDEKSSDLELRDALEGSSAVVISVGTTAFPTKKWANGNTPKAIDEEAVVRLANAAAETDSVRRVVLLTSVGVDRTSEMPFLILNLFGVLDAKKAGEDAIREAGERGAFDYAVVRPGRLVGGPYTNLDLAKLMQIEGGAENGVTVQAGDVLLGDCKRDACAEAVVQCLERAECKNAAFSVVSNDEAALTDEQWKDAFLGMNAE